MSWIWRALAALTLLASSVLVAGDQRAPYAYLIRVEGQSTRFGSGDLAQSGMPASDLMKVVWVTPGERCPRRVHVMSTIVP